MDIIFNTFELVALAAAVLIANRVCGDGESNWIEGLQLVAVYVLIAISFLVL
jgi:Ca2+:H+ antiporter